jgi:tRNA-uridine 2-sulfurtransferase
MTRERILVAMSGGVDSSVAAGLLLEQGYEVIGVTLHLWDYPEDGGSKGRCCAPEDIHDARRVAAFGLSPLCI